MDYSTEVLHRKHALSLLNQRGQEEAAIRQLDLLIAARPTFAYLIARAKALLASKRPNEAITDLRRAERINQDSVIAQFLLKKAFLSLGGSAQKRVQEADARLTALQKEGVIAELSLQALFEKADCDPVMWPLCEFDSLTACEQQIRELTEKLRKNRADTAALFARAYYYHCTARYIDAFYDYEQITRVAPDEATHSEGCEYAAGMLEALGRFEEASRYRSLAWYRGRDLLPEPAISDSSPDADADADLSLFVPLFDGELPLGRHEVIDESGRVVGAYEVEYNWSMSVYISCVSKPYFRLSVVKKIGLEIPDCPTMKDSISVTFEDAEDSACMEIEFDAVGEILTNINLFPPKECLTRSGIRYEISFQTFEFGGYLEFRNPTEGEPLQLEAELFTLARKVALWSGKLTLLQSIAAWRNHLWNSNL